MVNFRVLFIIVAVSILSASAFALSLDRAGNRSNGWTVEELDLPANGLAYDSTKKLIYASLRVSNTILAIDPVNGSTSLLITNIISPGIMAISDNDQYLYIAVKGGSYIFQYDLFSQTFVREFFLGRDGDTDYFAVDMLVMPEQPDTLAVARVNTIYPQGVGIYKNGGLLPNQTSGPSDSTRIEAASSARLYGYENTSSSHRFFTMFVDELGVYISNTTNNLIWGGFDIKYDRGNGLLYTSVGQAIDPISRTEINSYSKPWGGLIAPVSNVDRIFFYDWFDDIFSVHDQDDFIFLESMEIPMNGDFARDLIYMGDYHLVFYSTNYYNENSAIYLIRPNYNFSLTPEYLQKSGFPGSVMTFTLTLTNIGEFTDSYNIVTSPSAWPVSTIPSTGPLAPNGSIPIDIIVTIPHTLTGEISNTFNVEVTSLNMVSIKRISKLTSVIEDWHGNFIPLIVKK